MWRAGKENYSGTLERRLNTPREAKEEDKKETAENPDEGEADEQMDMEGENENDQNDNGKILGEFAWTQSPRIAIFIRNTFIIFF